MEIILTSQYQKPPTAVLNAITGCAKSPDFELVVPVILAPKSGDFGERGGGRRKTVE